MSRLKISLVATLFAVPALSVAGGQSLHLVPAPREIAIGSTQPIPQGVKITCVSCSTDPEDNFTAQDLTQSLAARSISTAGPFAIQLTRVQSLPDAMKPEGYTITPGTNSITLAAGSSAGLFYAAQTVKQLVENDGSAAVLHLASIRDWPAMQYRGVHDDLSRGPVPTLEFQKNSSAPFRRTRSICTPPTSSTPSSTHRTLSSHRRAGRCPPVMPGSWWHLQRNITSS